MTDKPQNPLSKHFRQPAIYIKLPSGGKYWKDGSLELPLSGELPVYPMVTADEIVLKTPDALMNGSSVVSVIQSCIPNIKNAWDAPSIDMDALLIAIRIASYGHTMDVTADCPKCEETSSYGIDLRIALESIHEPDYQQPLEIKGVKIKLRPQPYEESNKADTYAFEEQQLINSLTDANLDIKAKSEYIETQMRKMISVTNELLTKSTESITTADGIVVTEPEFISEFYEKAETEIVKSLNKKVAEIAKAAAIKPYNVQCEHCQHQFEMTVNFDYSSFFATGF